jgi:pimeloyl-[acyl-carrier protein] methyl ester esterase
MDLVLLPGMDGTARLFEPFVRALPPGWSAAPVRYPPDRSVGYDALLEQVPVPAGDFVLVAESFGGPLALKVAARNPTGLKAVALVATFIASPVLLPRAVARFLLSATGTAFFRSPPPNWALRRYLIGADASPEQVDALRRLIASVPPEVMAGRARAILNVDVTKELRTCPVPVLYLQGTKDHLIPRSMATRMQRIRPDMKVVRVEAPHLVLQQDPEACVRELRGFLDNIERLIL